MSEQRGKEDKKGNAERVNDNAYNFIMGNYPEANLITKEKPKKKATKTKSKKNRRTKKTAAKNKEKKPVVKEVKTEEKEVNKDVQIIDEHNTNVVEEKLIKPTVTVAAQFVAKPEDIVTLGDIADLTGAITGGDIEEYAKTVMSKQSPTVNIPIKEEKEEPLPTNVLSDVDYEYVSSVFNFMNTFNEFGLNTAIVYLDAIYSAGVDFDAIKDLDIGSFPVADLFPLLYSKYRKDNNKIDTFLLTERLHAIETLLTTPEEVISIPHDLLLISGIDAGIPRRHHPAGYRDLIPEVEKFIHSFLSHKYERYLIMPPEVEDFIGGSVAVSLASSTMLSHGVIAVPFFLGMHYTDEAWESIADVSPMVPYNEINYKINEAILKYIVDRHEVQIDTTVFADLIQSLIAEDYSYSDAFSFLNFEYGTDSFLQEALTVFTKLRNLLDEKYGLKDDIIQHLLKEIDMAKNPNAFNIILKTYDTVLSFDMAFILNSIKEYMLSYLLFKLNADKIVNVPNIGKTMLGLLIQGNKWNLV